MSPFAAILTTPARLLGGLRQTWTASRAAFSKVSGDSHWRKTAIAVADQAVVSATNFATSIVLGWCGKSELGLYYLALSLLVFVRGVQEQLVIAPYTIYHNHRKADASRFAGSTLAHQLLIAGAMSLVLALIFVTGWGPAQLVPLALLLAGVAPLYLLREYLRQISFAHLHVTGALYTDLLIAAIQLGVLVPLAVSGMLSVQLAWTAIAAAYGIAALVWFFSKRVTFVCDRAAIAADWLFNWRFGKWALASQLLACSSPYIVPWVVAFSHSEQETGVLGACMTLVGFSNMFLMGISNYLTPRAAQAYAHGGTSELKSVLKKTALLFLATLGPASVAAFSIGGWVVQFAYGPAFAGCGPIIGFLSLAALVNSMGVTAGNGLCAMDRPSANFRADLIAMCVSIFAMLLLVPWLGPLGAALSTLATVSSDAAIRGWTLKVKLLDLSAGSADSGTRNDPSKREGVN